MLDEIGTYLAANGIGTVGTNLFKGFMPDLPDAVVVLYETGGLAPYRAMRSAPGQPVATRPRLQVVCRNTQYEYAVARAKAQAVYVLLEGFGDQTLSGTRYLWIAAVQEPFMMGRDVTGRVQVAQNFDVVKEIS